MSDRDRYRPWFADQTDEAADARMRAAEVCAARNRDRTFDTQAWGPETRRPSLALRVGTRGYLKYPPEQADAEAVSIRYVGNLGYAHPKWYLVGLPRPETVLV